MIAINKIEKIRYLKFLFSQLWQGKTTPALEYLKQYCSDKRFTREVRTWGAGRLGGQGERTKFINLTAVSPCLLVPKSPSPAITKESQKRNVLGSPAMPTLLFSL